MQEDDGGSEQPEQSKWSYNSNDSTDTGSEPGVSWMATEFIDHQKAKSWYMGLGVGSALLALAVYLISEQDLVPSLVVLVVAVVFGIFASRKPRQLEYSISSDGVKIGSRTYALSDLRSFSQVEEDGQPSIWLMPLKRFMPIITLYFDPAKESEIIDVLSQYLPFEDFEPGIIDHLMHRLKF